MHVHDLGPMHAQHRANAPGHTRGIDDRASPFFERAFKAPADFARSQFVGTQM
jgi:hypothetical protein